MADQGIDQRRIDQEAARRPQPNEVRAIRAPHPVLLDLGGQLGKALRPRGQDDRAIEHAILRGIRPKRAQFRLGEALLAHLQEREGAAALRRRQQRFQVGIAECLAWRAGDRGAKRATGNQAIERIALQRGAAHPDGESPAIAAALRDPGGPECSRRAQCGRRCVAVGSLERHGGIALAKPECGEAADKLRLAVGRPHSGGGDRLGVTVLHEQRSRRGTGAPRRPACRRG